jgi:hypothetical protein
MFRIGFPQPALAKVRQATARETSKLSVFFAKTRDLALFFIL